MQEIIDDILLKHRVNALAVALRERDAPTGTHCNRVAPLALELGKRCGLEEKQFRPLQLAAMLHDIGKISIPDRVLLKSGSLDGAEWETMKSHSVLGERILLATQAPDMDVVAQAVRHHHENFDGSGYPDGLAGEAIPQLARIVAIVDNYDAIASLLPYHRARSHAEIMVIMAADAQCKFDPAIYEEFVKLAASPEFTFTRRMHEVHATRGVYQTS